MLRTLLTSAAAFALALATRLHAQTCEPEWLPGLQGTTFEGSVVATTTFDPDGAGPRPTLLVVGGSAIRVASVPTSKVMAFDGTAWSSIDLGGASGSVDVLHVHNGELYAAGTFTSIGGVSANGIAKWNGTTWAPLGLGVQGVRAMASFPTELWVGGVFTNAGGSAVSNLARWNGSTWSSPPGGGVSGASAAVNALHNLSGVMYVGGVFTHAGSFPFANIASHTGTGWASVGNADGEVRSFHSYSFLSINSARLVVAGNFNTIGGVAAPDFARYSPTSGTWSALGAITSFESAWRIFARSNGVSAVTLYATVSTTGLGPLGGGSTRVRVLDGTDWESIGIASGANAFTVYNGRLTIANGDVLTLDGSNWRTVNKGLPNRIESMVSTPSGLVAGGLNLLDQRGFAAVGRLDDATGDWINIGDFVLTPPFSAAPNIHALETLPDGSVLAGGLFHGVNGSPIFSLAKWDGASWQQLGSGMPQGSIILCVEPISNDEFIVGGLFTEAGGVSARHIARYQSGGWFAMGGNTFSNAVTSVKRMPNGDVIAGGLFTIPGGSAGVARWNGFGWSAMGAGFNHNVYSLAVAPDGTLYAAGGFTQSGAAETRRVARWTGTTWVGLGQGLGVATTSSSDVVRRLLVLPDGRLIAAGSFTQLGDGTPAANIALWNGTQWSAIDGGITSIHNNPALSVNALRLLPDGTIAAGGEFSHAGGRPSAYLARARFGNLADVAGPGQVPTPDGQLTADDIIVFIGLFFTGDARADVAGAGQTVGGDGQFTADDIIVFIGAFFGGC